MPSPAALAQSLLEAEEVYFCKGLPDGRIIRCAADVECRQTMVRARRVVVVGPRQPFGEFLY